MYFPQPTIKYTTGGIKNKQKNRELRKGLTISLPSWNAQNNLFPDAIARNRFRLITRLPHSHVHNQRIKLRKDKF